MKRIGIIAGVLVVVVVLIAIGLSFLIDANRFKPELESELSSVLGRHVSVGQLQFSILSGSVSAGDLAISEDPGFGAAAFLKAKSLNVGAELMPLVLSRKLNITGISIVDPEIVLLQSRSGAWNFSTLGNSKTGGQPNPKSNTSNTSGTSSTSPLDLSVKAINIRNGRVTIGQPGSRKKPLVLENVDVVVKDFSIASQCPFSVSTKVSGGGNIKLDGKTGPIHPTDASMTPFDLTLKISGLDLAGTGLNSMAPDIAAIVSLDGTGTSDGTNVKVKGHLKAARLKLSKNGTPSRIPVELDLEDQHALRKNSGVLQRAVAHVGKSQATLTGTYQERGESTELKMNLSGTSMAATDLAALLPALNVVLPAGSSIQTGTLNLKLSSEGPADKLVTTGNIAFTNVKLAGFDLGKKMTAIEKLAGMKTTPDMVIQTASTNVRAAPEGLSADDIQFVVTGFGNLAGRGTVSPSNLLDFKMNATVQAATLTSALGNNLSVPFTIQGSSSDPIFRPDVKAIANTQLKEAGTKAVGSFLNNLLNGKKKSEEQ
jgi:AsmA protein